MSLSLTTADLRGYLDQVPDLAAQRVTITGNPTGGDYVLAYAGTLVAPLAPNATAATVQAALTTVAATPSDPDPLRVYGPAGGPYLVQWRALSARQVSPLVLSANNLTGGSTPGVAIVPALDGILADILTRAEQMVEAALLPVAFAPYAPGDRLVFSAAQPSRWLRIPPNEAGSVTAVTRLASPDDAVGVPVTAWVSDPDGRHLIAGDLPWEGKRWYRVTAAWGYGPATSDAQQLALELAVNMWRSRDRGLWSEAQGVEGAGEVRYIGGLNSTQRMVITNIRRQFKEIIQ